jgi:hypothetical protein
MRILGLDLGTHTGWCYVDPKQTSLGTWTLSTDAEVKEWGKQRLTRRGDPRMFRLSQHLHTFRDRVDIVVFEDVEFQTFRKQTQLWSSFRTVVWMAFGQGVYMDCVPVHTLKKFATGSGSADKNYMMNAACAAFPQRFAWDSTAKNVQDLISGRTLDDNALDAFWLAQWANKHLARIKK